MRFFARLRQAAEGQAQDLELLVFPDGGRARPKHGVAVSRIIHFGRHISVVGERPDGAVLISALTTRRLAVDWMKTGVHPVDGICVVAVPAVAEGVRLSTSAPAAIDAASGRRIFLAFTFLLSVGLQYVSCRSGQRGEGGAERADLTPWSATGCRFPGSKMHRSGRKFDFPDGSSGSPAKRPLPPSSAGRGHPLSRRVIHAFRALTAVRAGIPRADTVTATRPLPAPPLERQRDDADIWVAGLTPASSRRWSTEAGGRSAGGWALVAGRSSRAGRTGRSPPSTGSRTCWWSTVEAPPVPADTPAVMSVR